jgi:hypothetical protein
MIHDDIHYIIVLYTNDLGQRLLNKSWKTKYDYHHNEIMDEINSMKQRKANLMSIFGKLNKTNLHYALKNLEDIAKLYCKYIPCNLDHLCDKYNNIPIVNAHMTLNKIRIVNNRCRYGGGTYQNDYSILFNIMINEHIVNVCLSAYTIRWESENNIVVDIAIDANEYQIYKEDNDGYGYRNGYCYKIHMKSNNQIMSIESCIRYSIITDILNDYLQDGHRDIFYELELNMENTRKVEIIDINIKHLKELLQCGKNHKFIKNHIFYSIKHHINENDLLKLKEEKRADVIKKILDALDSISFDELMEISSHDILS